MTDLPLAFPGESLCRHCWRRMEFHRIMSVRYACERMGGPQGGWGEPMSAEERKVYDEMVEADLKEKKE